jgi:4-hydroxy-tetrahydrodipicolinate synthase
MAESKLRGVIAAVATPVNEDGSPDIARATKLARYLIDNGCDGLNVLGTTGEATSFSTAQRMKVMTAYRAGALPLERMMVGTGAAALDDAIALTRHAAELGFGGALVLPPFYYKGVPDDGLVAYIETLVRATAERPIPIYLYHFPAQSGLPWHVKLVKRLLDVFGTRIVGPAFTMRFIPVREDLATRGRQVARERIKADPGLAKKVARILAE